MATKRSAQPGALDMTGLSGILEYSPEDMVVTALAGTPLSELQAELACHGQSLPLPDPSQHGQLLAGVPGTVGGLTAMNLPHGLMAQCGSVADWTLGLTAVRPNGEVVKCGSKVVKSVAGYDIHKFLVGSRGILAVIASVTFLARPIRTIPEPSASQHRPWGGEPVWIQTSRLTDFKDALKRSQEPFASDPAACTIWHSSPPERSPQDRITTISDWPPLSELDQTLTERAKRIFDPDGKLNPDVFVL